MDYHSILTDPSFPSFLAKIDAEIAELFRDQGCNCGGKLHRSNFLRSLGFGLTEESDKAARVRYSFSCAEDGCRKRMTPPSLRFIHGKWFLSVVIIFMSALQHGLTGERRAELIRHLGVSNQMINRWRKWWQETFVKSAMWRTWRSRCVVESGDAVVDALLQHFSAATKTLRDAVVLMCTLVGACRVDDPTALFTIVQGHLDAATNTQSMMKDVKIRTV
jgi:hypothetical protein